MYNIARLSEHRHPHHTDKHGQDLRDEVFLVLHALPVHPIQRPVIEVPVSARPTQLDLPDRQGVTLETAGTACTCQSKKS
jgi:hypothetical protein